MRVKITTFQLIINWLKRTPNGKTIPELKTLIQSRSTSDIKENLRILKKYKTVQQAPKRKKGFKVWIHKNFLIKEENPTTKPKSIKVGDTLQPKDRRRPKKAKVTNVHKTKIQVLWPTGNIGTINKSRLHKYQIINHDK